MYMLVSQHVHDMSEDKKVRWTIASARQNLPTLVDLAAREPQEIYRRDTLVARVVSADPGTTAQPAGPTAAELLGELRRVCAEEGYELPVSPRVDRPNAFVDAMSITSRKKRTPTKRTRTHKRQPAKVRR
jgi:hypothetical protein